MCSRETLCRLKISKVPADNIIIIIIIIIVNY
jgi:hypothetical protein